MSVRGSDGAKVVGVQMRDWCKKADLVGVGIAKWPAAGVRRAPTRERIFVRPRKLRPARLRDMNRDAEWSVS